MFNIMLDKLPTEWNGHRIRTDFRIGIQIVKCLEDDDFNVYERIARAAELLFENIELLSFEEARAGLSWFLTDFCHDNYSGVKTDDVPLMDYDIDQWRIYSAFRNQYGIDINKEQLHWFVFMGMMNNLDECAYTKVIDLRRKNVKANMSPEYKKNLTEAKQIFAIKKEEIVSEEEKLKHEEAAIAFNRLRNRS